MKNKATSTLNAKQLISDSGYFNSEYYLNQVSIRAQKPNTNYHKTANVFNINNISINDPIEHFMEIGWQTGFSPSVHFDIQFYITEYPDVTSFGNPLVHFLLYGKQERRYPTKLSKISEIELIAKSDFFDSEFYSKQLTEEVQLNLLKLSSHNTEYLPDLKSDLISHYLVFGWKDELNPSIKFETNFYLEEYSDVAHFGNPLVHFLLHGRQEGRYPTKSTKDNSTKEKLSSELTNLELVINSGYFLESFYKEQLPLTPYPKNLALHYIEDGWIDGHNPSEKFNTKYYLSRYPETVGNPLIDYLVNGRNNGKFASEDEEVKHDIKIITLSNSFDVQYYLQTYSNQLDQDEDPLIHFVKYGWKNNLNPSGKFDTQYYKEANKDVKTNPLVHFVKYGWYENRHPKQNLSITDLISADITHYSYILYPEKPQTLKIAVVIHIFYCDLIDEIYSYITNIAHANINFDLLITTTEECYSYVKEMCLKHTIGAYKIFVTKNIGKDIGPFVTAIGSECLKYDLVCKIHTKKSIHDPELVFWREHILNNLLGSKDIIKQILFEFENDSRLGLVNPIIPPSLIKMLFAARGWSSNWEKSQNMLEMLNIQTEPWNEFLEFPAGSMFWFRPEALRPLFDLNLKISDFEEGQILDGSLAHCIERFFCLIAQKQNFITKRIFLKKDAWSKSLYHTDNIIPYISLNYLSWINKYEQKKSIQQLPKEVNEAKNDISHSPLISIILPTFNTEEKFLHECIQSVLKQSYKNWELCIADDGSTNHNVIKILNSYAKFDSRIKVIIREKNGHIAAASNSALKLVSGEYVGLLDHDDILNTNALDEVITIITKYPNANLIYSDSDKIDINGIRHDPLYKPSWNPDLLLAQNYISQFCVLRTKLVKELNGFNINMSGSQDYDLFLRFTEIVSEETIFHIPKILYHWRTSQQSVATNRNAKIYAIEKARKALQESLRRRKVSGRVIGAEKLEIYSRIVYQLPIITPQICVILTCNVNSTPTVIETINDFLDKSIYTNLSISVVIVGELEKTLYKALLDLQEKEFLKIHIFKSKEDISNQYNTLLKNLHEEYYLLIDSDIRIINSDAIIELMSQALQPEIGVVGPKIYDEENTILDAGANISPDGKILYAYSNTPRDQEKFINFGRSILNRNLSFVSSKCMLFSHKDFVRVNGFTKSMSGINRDIDFCSKLRNEGLRILFAANAHFYGSRLKNNTLSNKNKKIYYSTYLTSTTMTTDPFYNPNFWSFVETEL